MTHSKRSTGWLLIALGTMLCSPAIALVLYLILGGR